VDSLLLELLAPRRLGVSCESPNLVEDHKKVCITRFVLSPLRGRFVYIFLVCGF
jgi:hypothetical protein